MACDLPANARCPIGGGPPGGQPGQPGVPEGPPDIEPEIPFRPIPVRPLQRMAADDVDTEDVQGPSGDLIN